MYVYIDIVHTVEIVQKKKKIEQQLTLTSYNSHTDLQYCQ